VKPRDAPVNREERENRDHSQNTYAHTAGTIAKLDRTPARSA